MGRQSDAGRRAVRQRHGGVSWSVGAVELGAKSHGRNQVGRRILKRRDDTNCRIRIEEARGRMEKRSAGGDPTATEQVGGDALDSAANRWIRWGPNRLQTFRTLPTFPPQSQPRATLPALTDSD